MKKANLFHLGALVIGIAAHSATAYSTVVLQGGPYQNGIGGEWTATLGGTVVEGLPAGMTFQTFCLKYTDLLAFGAIDYADLDTGANLGGAGGYRPIPLDPRVAWLYNEFLNQTLAGYDFTGPARYDCAGQLQSAIWYLENEITCLESGSPAEQFVQMAEAADWDSIHDIRVLTLYGDVKHDLYRQDILCRIIVAPVPGALVMVGLGVLLTRRLRRRHLS